MNSPDYVVVLTPLTEQDGGGWMATVPELPGCISDGDTREEAATNVREAITLWCEAQREDAGREPPAPGTWDRYSGKFQLRIPKTLHANLAYLAEREGLSMNAMASYLLSEGVNRRLAVIEED